MIRRAEVTSTSPFTVTLWGDATPVPVGVGATTGLSVGDPVYVAVVDGVVVRVSS